VQDARHDHPLAVHPIRHATVARDRVAKVLDAKRALEARGEEAAEGCEERGERCHDERVDLERCVRNRGDREADL
jgi:hypothetical protein